LNPNTENNVEVYEVITATNFDNEVERFVKKKKFRSLPKQVIDLMADLEEGKLDGTLYRHKEDPIYCDIYKIRLPTPDANAGKSNGYRVIYVVVSKERRIVLLTVYYKKEQTTVPDFYIDGLIDGICFKQIN
jgi:mRNA-degrading endonuclease RelE of RelBE toxin-antitoxin system